MSSKRLSTSFSQFSWVSRLSHFKKLLGQTHRAIDACTRMTELNLIPEKIILTAGNCKTLLNSLSASMTRQLSAPVSSHLRKLEFRQNYWTEYEIWTHNVIRDAGWRLYFSDSTRGYANAPFWTQTGKASTSLRFGYNPSTPKSDDVGLYEWGSESSRMKSTARSIPASFIRNQTLNFKVETEAVSQLEIEVNSYRDGWLRGH